MASDSAPSSACLRKAAPIVAVLLQRERPTWRGAFQNNRESILIGTVAVAAAACTISNASVYFGELANATWSLNSTTVAVLGGSFFIAGYICRCMACPRRHDRRVDDDERDPAADE